MIGFVWALGASFVVSLISLVGIFSLLLKEDFLERVLILLIGFSAGALIGASFLHLLPEALEQSRDSGIFIFVILGFIFFFILERYIHWRHCHLEACDIHAFTYLNLVGDSVHNFTDGLVIGASFTISVHFGVITSLVIILHEIPQEMGDFGVLVYGGFTKTRALCYNFLTALFCVLGTVIGFPLAEKVGHFSLYLLPITAGGFIYIAACDLIPEIHKQKNQKRSAFSVLAFLCGILFIFLARLAGPH